RPDLTVINPGNIPSSISQGDNVDFTYQIKNIGDASTGGTDFDVRLEIDLERDGSWNVQKDIRRYTSSIAAGATTSTLTDVDQWTAVVGSHKYRICADYPESEVYEWNGDNNCSSEVNFVVAAPLPDLTCVEPRYTPTTVVLGNNVDFFFKIRNKGTLGTGQLANPAFNMRLQIDYNGPSDGISANVNTNIYNRTTGIGAGNTTNELSGSAWTTSRAGDHTYRICADPPAEDMIPELIDSWVDNCSSWNDLKIITPTPIPPTPVPLPDLTIVEPRSNPEITIVEGSAMDFFFKIRNKGTLGTAQLPSYAFNVRLQVDYERDGTANRQFDIYRRTTGIGAGNTTNEISGSPTWTAVYGTTGNHRYRICADMPDNEIPEIIDSWLDNCSSWVNFVVTLTPPTLPPPTEIPTDTPIPTPIPQPWFKLKNASLVGILSINSPIPNAPLTPYDSDDPGNRYLLENSVGNSPGVTSGQNISIGGASVSDPVNYGWKTTGTTYSPQYTVEKFMEYARSKKTTSVVEIIDIANAQTNKINIYTGNLTLTDAQVSSKRPLVLIVIGNLTLSGTTFNSSNGQQIIMATGKIIFPTTMTAANGLFIADSLDFGTTSNQGIKIVGNFIAQSSFSNEREWSNAKRPGLFMIFDPSHYLELLNMNLFSTTMYDWREIQ
ncbi:MAG: CARDB domain-containing protein, partial [bacterium]